MFNHVDLVGVDAVCNQIKQTDLKRFIIYRQGAAKGSTPVFDCSYTTNNAAALKNFRDWANNITQYNPNSNLCYDLLLFNDFEENLGDIQNRNPNEENLKSGRKHGKIRFCFCLSNVGAGMQSMNGNNFSPPVDIAGEITKGIESAMMKKENEELKAKIKELESEEEEEEESEDFVGKITGMINAIKGGKVTEEEAAEIGNEKSIEKNLTEHKNKWNFTPAEVTMKTKNCQTALKTLWQHDKELDIHLLKLSEIAKSNKFLFQMIIEKIKAL